MDSIRYDLNYLSNPEIFSRGRLPAVSDHLIYANADEATRLESSLCRCLDGQWRFAYSENIQARPVGFEKTDFDCSAWDLITVPGHIQMQGYGAPQYVNTQYPWDGHEVVVPPNIPQRFNPVGSYVTHFSLTKQDLKNRIVLTFHGVESAFFLWINGQLVGYAEDSFTPSHFDITPFACEGENKLAVEVFRFSSASWLEDQDFWRFSGIFRSVELHLQPTAHVKDLFVKADPGVDYQTGELSAEIQLNLPETPVQLTYELFERDTKKLVDSCTFPAAHPFELNRTLPSPRLWSAEYPNLYTLRLTLADENGAVYEVAQTNIGFRRFELKNGLMCLNGKRILFHGTNRHEFGCRSGRALPYEEMLKDIQLLKKNNINAVRTSHYPNQTAWYHLCDEHGIYLIDEANLETHGTWQVPAGKTPQDALPGDHEEWLGACLDRAQSMLERDKNRPSVLMWSCGNESFGGSVIFQMSEFFRHRDPTRLVHYEGVCEDRRYNDTSDMESRMYPPATEVAAWIENNPEKPFILCEYSHAMGNSCGGLSEYLALEDRYPRYQGGFIWDWCDQAIVGDIPGAGKGFLYGGDFNDQPNDRHFCGNGLVFADRSPTPRLQEIKYLYQDVRLTPDNQGCEIENRFLFNDLSGFYLRWTLHCDGVACQDGTIEDVTTPAGNKRHLPFQLPALSENGEYTLLCELCLKEDTYWAPKGYSQMHGQSILKAAIKTKDIPAAQNTVSICRANAGIYTEGAQALFSYVEGGLVSLARHGQNTVLNYPPRPDLFRAPIDNDTGSGFTRDTALWKAFSELAKAECLSAENPGDHLSVQCRYILPSLTDVEVRVHYEALSGQKIRMTVSFPGKQNLPYLPAFGLSFRLPNRLSNMRYYGMGPDENGNDRCKGAILGIFETNVKDNLTPYLKPQFCGNRMGVRWMELTDHEGLGLRVRAEETPLEITVLPNSQSELAAALHREQLPSYAYTYMNVAMARYGVGGDNSWGAHTLEKYRLHSDKPLSFSFILELI